MAVPIRHQRQDNFRPPGQRQNTSPQPPVWQTPPPPGPPTGARTQPATQAPGTPAPGYRPTGPYRTNGQHPAYLRRRATDPRPERSSSLRPVRLTCRVRVKPQGRSKQAGPVGFSGPRQASGPVGFSGPNQMSYGGQRTGPGEQFRMQAGPAVDVPARQFSGLNPNSGRYFQGHG